MPSAGPTWNEKQPRPTRCSPRVVTRPAWLCFRAGRTAVCGAAGARGDICPFLAAGLAAIGSTRLINGVFSCEPVIIFCK